MSFTENPKAHLTDVVRKPDLKQPDIKYIKIDYIRNNGFCCIFLLFQ